MSQLAVELTDLRFAWPRQAPILEIPSFQLREREHLLLKGPSGAGKTTLLSLIAGVLTPLSGEVQVAGQNLGALSASGRDGFRADAMGLMFQQFNLIPFLDVKQNISLALGFSRKRMAAATRERPLSGEIDRLLAGLGLDASSIAGKTAGQLSVGQQQRVAAVRALIGRPRILIADEPTSALDPDARADFLKLIFAECRTAGISLIVVSHDTEIAPLFDRTEDLRHLNRAAAAPTAAGQACG